MKLKGIELKGTYKVNFDDDFFAVYDEKGNHVYTENSKDVWFKKEYNEKGEMIYYEDNKGIWFKQELDTKGNITYFEHSNGFWEKSEYDSKGNLIYFEDRGGYIVDKRPKELTIGEIEKLLGYKIKVKGE